MEKHEISVTNVTFDHTAFNDVAGELTFLADVNHNGIEYNQLPIFRLTCVIDRSNPGDDGFGKVTVTTWCTPLVPSMTSMPAFRENLRHEALPFIAANFLLQGTAVYEGVRLWWKGKHNQQPIEKMKRSA